MGGGFHGCDVLILAFLLTSYVQNLSTANLWGRPIFLVGSKLHSTTERKIPSAGQQSRRQWPSLATPCYC